MFTISLVLRLALLAIFVHVTTGCDSGCPDGMREYQDDCIPISSDQTHSDPVIIDGDDSEPEIYIPTPIPIDYNSLPTDSGEEPETVDNLDNTNVPEDTAGLVFWIEGTPGGILWPEQIRDPEDNLVYDFMTDAEDGSINDSFDFHYYPDSSLSLFLPNTPRLPFSSGDWSIKIGSDGSTEPSVTMLRRTKRPEDYIHTQISLNLWFTDLPNLNATNAGSNKTLEKSLDVFKELLETAGIRVNNIFYHDVPSDVAQRYADISDMTEFHDMFPLTEEVDNPWPNLFLIRSFSGADLAGVIGMAAHIPGPATLQGTRYSGVAISMEYFEMFPRITGLTMAHELAHWMGLFHTSEAFSGFYDALDDTAECDPSKDTNQDGLIDIIECANYGGNNIMFWMVPLTDAFAIGENGVSFSADQSWVLERNPLVEYTP